MDKKSVRCYAWPRLSTDNYLNSLVHDEFPLCAENWIAMLFLQMVIGYPHQVRMAFELFFFNKDKKKTVQVIHIA